MEKDSRIFVAGHRGMVGSALVRHLQDKGFQIILTAPKNDLDLRNMSQVTSFFTQKQPEYVFLSAAKVGGIQANRQYPADFIYNNLMIQNNVIHQSHLSGVKKLMFLGSSCAYPRECPQPIKEEYLLTGPLEPTNEAYALAKIAGIRMAQYYEKQYGLHCICPIPCNLYGPNDNFDPQDSHVLSALVKKFTDAVDEGKDNVTLWGSGIARREFLHVDDVADALIFLMGNYNSSEIINIGSGKDISIRELSELIAQKVSYKGKTSWDTSMPDGMLRKCLDISKISAFGFQPRIQLTEGIVQVIDAYRSLKTINK
jgi:GDP-L-fucose synthase